MDAIRRAALLLQDLLHAVGAPASMEHFARSVLPSSKIKQIGKKSKVL